MFKQIIKLKLQWYKKSVMQSFYDYSVSFLLWGSTLIFGVVNLNSIAKPISIMLQSGLSIKSMTIYLVTLITIFVAWFYCQKNILFNQKFESYLKTLPISIKQECFSCITMIFISNHLLWCIILTGMYIAWDNISGFILVGEVLFLMVSMVSIQLSLYYHQLYKLLLLAVINYLFIFAKINLSSTNFLLGVTGLIGLCVWLSLTNLRYLSRDKWPSLPMFRLGPIAPVIAVQFAMLKPYNSRLILKVIATMALQIVMVILISHHEDNPDVIYAIPLLALVSLAIMSFVARALMIETNTMAVYFATLPISKLYLLIKNVCFSSFISMVLILTGLIVAWLHSVTSFSTLIYLCVSSLIINSLVYYMESKSFRNTNFIVFITVCGLYFGTIFIR